MTNHSYVVVPSALCVVLRSRPLETSIIESGTVIATRWLSGSSACVSLFGHQTLAPSPWLAVATQRLPSESRVQVKPPSQGGVTRDLRLAVVVDGDGLRARPILCGSSERCEERVAVAAEVRARDDSCVMLSTTSGCWRSICISRAGASTR